MALAAKQLHSGLGGGDRGGEIDIDSLANQLEMPLARGRGEADAGVDYDDIQPVELFGTAVQYRGDRLEIGDVQGCQHNL